MHTLGGLVQGLDGSLDLSNGGGLAAVHQATDAGDVSLNR